MAAGLLDQLDMGVERHSRAAAGKEMGGHVERDVMALGHSRAAPPANRLMSMKLITAPPWSDPPMF
jgi:hypothetical protein